MFTYNFWFSYGLKRFERILRDVLIVNIKVTTDYSLYNLMLIAD